MTKEHGRWRESRDGDATTARLSGRLTAETAADYWPMARDWLERANTGSLTLDCSDLDYADGAGIALLVYLRGGASRTGKTFNVVGLSEDARRVYGLYPAEKFAEASIALKRGGRSWIEEVGEAAWCCLVGVKEHFSFIGELTVGIARVIARPRDLRLKDLALVMEASGPRAIPIVVMLGFLVGLILAFQGAVLMAQFGAEIYIADFVGKSVARELGPLITAIIVAGRTGSAFAAEIGTMKVNEEIDAFSTMGLDPVRFLVIPRVVAATLMTPLLAVLTNLCGMLGGAVVMRGIGFPFVTYVNRLLGAVTMMDYAGGLFKTLVFGLLISGAGCLCGLRTGEGASAVGNSATRAVVSSIIMIVITDGVFAVLFYYLGI